MSTSIQAPPGIEHETEFVRGPDGERLFVQRWRPQGTVRAVVVLAHGVGEHSDCYWPFVEYFVPRGAAIYAHDHRGFGRSDGRRGHVPRYERFVEDLRPLVERARREHPGLPVVLVGHSMGGTIALLFALRYPALLDRAVCSAPALMVGLPVPAWKRLLGRTMSRLYPTYTDVAVFNPALLTRDPAIQQSAREDTLRHTRKTARLYTEMFVRGPREVLARAGELRLPFLLLHGAEDPLVPVEASRRLYAAATAADRSMQVYPAMRHEVLRELGREQVFADVAAWLVSRGVEVGSPAIASP